ncbi:3-hydroxy-3-methylglutaryl-coenzyme A (HMG-CoA) reductase isozyme, partial [Tulasnella sp. 427]
MSSTALSKHSPSYFADTSDAIKFGVSAMKQDWTRNHAIECAVLLVGAVSAVSRLGDLTAFAGLLIFADCLALWAFYVVSYNVIIQLHRIQLAKQHIAEAGTLGDKHDDGSHYLLSPLTKEKYIVRLKALLIPTLAILHMINVICAQAFYDAMKKKETLPEPSRLLVGSNDLSDDELLSDILMAAEQHHPADSTSKWLAVILIISVLLNVYYMRVISFAAAATTHLQPAKQLLPALALDLPPVIEEEEKRTFRRRHTVRQSEPCVPSASQLQLHIPKPHPTHIDIPLAKPLGIALTESPVEVSSTLSERTLVEVETTTSSAVMTLVANTPTASTAELVRTFEECVVAYEKTGVSGLDDEEVIMLCQKGKIAAYALEKVLGSHSRAVKIRRA